MAQSALEEPCDIVAVAGGDGMVGQVAKHLIDRQIPIAVIPMGTANNVAKTLGLTNKTITQVIAGWKAGLRVNFDAGVASGPWDSKFFIEGLGMGLFTETMYRLDARDNVDLAHLDDSEEKVTSVLQILKERLRTFTPNQLKITLGRAGPVGTLYSAGSDEHQLCRAESLSRPSRASR